MTSSPEAARLDRLRQRLRALDLDALLVSQPESRRYLSGYTADDHPPLGSAGLLLVGEEAALLLTDPRTTELARRQAPLFEVVEYPTLLQAMATVADTATRLGVRRLGVEANHLPLRRFRELVAASNERLTLVDTYDLVDELRAVKDESEIAAIAEGARLLDRAFYHLVEQMRPGQTERELAWWVEAWLRTHGADDVAFPPIIASGPNAAIPHAEPTDRTVQEGEPITVDIGARVNGYASDMTRTVCLGTAPPQLSQVHAIVLRALRRAREFVRPGVTGREVDAEARRIITEAGYGERFIHALGHGVGLAVHEPPRLGRTGGEGILDVGMVFTIEPGVYLPGWGGVRIEDLVCLDDAGVRQLTGASHHLECAEVLRDLNR
ncbi:MAG TPA: aminopeptidase P family protein [Chloroflexota bacterium]